MDNGMIKFVPEGLDVSNEPMKVCGHSPSDTLELEDCCHTQEVSRTFSYDEFIKHQKNSSNFKFCCPNECCAIMDGHAKARTFKSLDALQHHLESECPKSSYNCLNCECKMERHEITERHDETACVAHLIKAYSEVNDDNIKLLKTKLDLDQKYEELDV